VDQETTRLFRVRHFYLLADPLGPERAAALAVGNFRFPEDMMDHTRSAVRDDAPATTAKSRAFAGLLKADRYPG
jgi:hypothetical protein